MRRWPRGGQLGVTRADARGPDPGPLVFQELFSKQKGYLDEELDYRKQVLDQAHKVRETRLRNPWGKGNLVPSSSCVPGACVGQASDP